MYGCSGLNCYCFLRILLIFRSVLYGFNMRLILSVPTLAFKNIRQYIIVFFLLASVIAPLRLYAQMVSQLPDRTHTSSLNDLRIEKVRVNGGAEIYTIFAKLGKPDEYRRYDGGEMPLVSILRDTLDDNRPENDRFRYVWMLTYARPSIWKKMTAAIPFFYSRTTNKTKVGKAPPPPIIDLSPPGNNGMNKLIIAITKKLILGELGFFAKAPVQQYSQNTGNYRRSAIARTLEILSLYHETEGEKLLSDQDLKDIQAKLWLTGKSLGGRLPSEKLSLFYDKETANAADNRGHNWELLRQYSDRQGLYFEPLPMPDGIARLAIVWTAESDVLANKGKNFDSRFLNIKSPWSDAKFLKWKGYSQVRWFDAENRIVEPQTPNAQPKKLIPLALYGLDHTKIPIILVDFRNNANPKLRELSHRVITDVFADMLSIINFGDLPYFAARSGLNFLTGRRGADINQPSRIKSYAQLKLMLLLDEKMDVQLKQEITRRMEADSINPLENDMAAEARIAKAQYENLIAYAKRPGGLASKLEKDRREEMVKLKHGSKERMLFSTAHLFSLGLYTHREKATPELLAAMDVRRQLEYHERIVRQIANASSRPEIDSDTELLTRSLQFISENGVAAKEKTVKALSRIFTITQEETMRSLCLSGLYRINNLMAKKELLTLYQRTDISDSLRRQCAEYLKLALKEKQLIDPRDAEIIAGIAAN